jgi:hypothetical protein
VIPQTQTLVSAVLTRRYLHIHPVWFDTIQFDEMYQPVDIDTARFDNLDKHEALHITFSIDSGHHPGRNRGLSIPFPREKMTRPCRSTACFARLIMELKRKVVQSRHWLPSRPAANAIVSCQDRVNGFLGSRRAANALKAEKQCFIRDGRFSKVAVVAFVGFFALLQLNSWKWQESSGGVEGLCVSAGARSAARIVLCSLQIALL